MRRIILTACIILILPVIATGCLQPPAANPVPAPALNPLPPVSETLPPAVASATSPGKTVTFEISQTESSVTVTYTGGPDASSLSSITIRIPSRDGTQVDLRTIQNPATGSYIFTPCGLASPAVANIVGNFNDGTRQTGFMYYF